MIHVGGMMTAAWAPREQHSSICCSIKHVTLLWYWNTDRKSPDSCNQHLQLLWFFSYVCTSCFSTLLNDGQEIWCISYLANGSHLRLRPNITLWDSPPACTTSSWWQLSLCCEMKTSVENPVGEKTSLGQCRALDCLREVLIRRTDRGSPSHTVGTSLFDVSCGPSDVAQRWTETQPHFLTIWQHNRKINITAAAITQMTDRSADTDLSDSSRAGFSKRRLAPEINLCTNKEHCEGKKKISD